MMPKVRGKTSGESEERTTDTPAVFCASLHRPGWLLFAMICATFMQGAVTDGFVNTSITSIERRFSLSSTQSGMIVSMYSLTGVFVNLFVAYVGGRGHKARWLSAGMALYGIGALIYCLPHSLSGYYKHSQNDDKYSSVCKLGPTNGTQLTASEMQVVSGVEDTDHLSNYLYFFIVAQVAFGLGAAPLYTVGLAYLDENVSVAKSGLYFAILYTFGILGPAVGYITGGVLLRFYTDFRRADTVTITPEDPGWVGAWWVGMLLASPISFGVALFLLVFPMELPGTAEIRKAKVSVAHKSGGEDILATRADFGDKPTDFFIALKLLFRNPTLMFLNAGTCSQAIIIVGFASFLPKFVETLFGQTASFSATLVGAIVICGGCTGNFLGGWLVKRYRWGVRADLYCCMGACICSMVLFTGVRLRCPNENYVITPQHSESGSPDCLAQCYCESVDHTPVCSMDGQYEFFSPCHAGCTQDFENNTYGNCICILEQPLLIGGGCGHKPCPQLYFFTFGLFLTIMVLFLPLIPALHALLRCVPESQRSLSLGLSGVMFKVFGSFPAPIVLGAIFDSTCTVWQSGEGSSGEGSCWLYAANKLSWRVLMLCEVLTVATIVSSMLSVYLYAPVDHSKEEEQAAAIPLDH